MVVVADTAGEGTDKPCLALDCGAAPGLQRDELIERVAAANDRTIVVLETAGPVLTPWRHQVKAIVEAWYPGSGGGAAIARVLFGDVDPGGRLPASFPARARDLPTAGSRRRYPGVADKVHYSEGVLVGYRWFEQRNLRMAFPFGHGLSYGRFSFEGPARAAGGQRRARQPHRAQPRPARRHRRAAALPRAAGRARPRPAAPQLKGFESVALRRAGASA